MASKESRREVFEEEATMTSDMKVMYKAFVTQFQKLNSRLDEMDEWRKEVTQAISESSKQVGARNRHNNDSNREPSEDEYDEFDSIRNRRAGNRGRMDSNINAIKMQIPPFKGRNDAEAYLEWERKVEKIFACHDYAEEKKLRLAAVEFSDYALIWCHELMKSRRRNGERPIETWEEMKRVMKKRFVPSYYYREIHQKLHRLIQGSKSVENYHKEMEMLMIKANTEENIESEKKERAMVESETKEKERKQRESEGKKILAEKERKEAMREKNKDKGPMVSEKKRKKNEESEKGKKVESERIERKSCFYVKENDLKSAFLSKRAMVLIRFREVLLFETNLNPDLPSGFVSLLHEFEDVFPNEVQSGLPPIRGIEHQIMFDRVDWVWVHLRKERFPTQRKSKLDARGDGPFQVLEMINDKAYKIDLSGEYNVSVTFNVFDLSPFDIDADSRTNLFEEGGNDTSSGGQIGHSSTRGQVGDFNKPMGPITRVRAKRLKEGFEKG